MENKNYEIFNKIYFSELTFYPNGGYLKYKNDDIDFTLGNLLQILGEYETI